MPIEALWSLKFESDIGAYGGGVVAFQNGKVFGGDLQYTYIGTYSISGNVFSVKARISLYAGEPNSIFGPIASFNVKLSGKCDDREMILDGNIQGGSDNAMRVICTRRADLP